MDKKTDRNNLDHSDIFNGLPRLDRRVNGANAGFIHKLIHQCLVRKGKKPRCFLGVMPKIPEKEALLSTTLFEKLKRVNIAKNGSGIGLWWIEILIKYTYIVKSFLTHPILDFPLPRGGPEIKWLGGSPPRLELLSES